jgi:thiol-disulfide isomerase/thioredoxin
MGKASRIKQQSARDKIAAQRAAAKRAQARNRMLITVGSIGLVVVVVVAFVLIYALRKPGSATGNTSQLTGSQLAGVVNKVTTVPASTLAAVGKGSSYAHMMIPVTGAPLTSGSPPAGGGSSAGNAAAGGKPLIVYMGAEYCPYCATERWAMAVALSRFGTLHGVGAIHSDPNDTPAYIPTLTFYKSTYTSKYLAFTPVEMETVSKAPLQKPTAAQNALIRKYDAPPFLPANSAGSIPFVDFGNKWIISGASYDYSLLQGKTWSQVAAAMQSPSSPIAQGADGAANMMTAAICKLTSNQPANVCTAPVIKSLQGQI